MQASRFNVQVPVPNKDEVFLMNTFSDAQLLVSSDVAGLLDRVSRGQSPFTDEDCVAIESGGQSCWLQGDYGNGMAPAPYASGKLQPVSIASLG